MDESTVFTPTILDAVRRHPFLVALTAIAFAGLGLLASRVVLNDWEAQAAVLIQDPAVSQVFDTGSITQPERYLASQVAIIESRAMAETVHEAVEGHDLTIREVIESRRVLTTRETDLIVMSFRDPDPDLAVAFVNAFGDSYLDYRDQVTTASTDLALAGLDESIGAVDQELNSIDQSIRAVLTAEEDSELRENLEAAIGDLLASGAEPEDTELLNLMASQLQALQVIRSLEAQSPTLSLLLQSRGDIMARRSQLVVRRDQLMVEAALASDGIVAFNGATEAELSLSTWRVIAIGLMVGAFAGIGLAYYRTRRNRLFEHRSEPEAILEIPLLAEVPEFGRGSVEGMPVLKNPSSSEAEAFRFASNAMITRLNHLALESEGEGKSIAITSALLAAGKTIVTLNTALSVATRGRSVLIFDADFGDPSLSRMLTGDPSGLKGVTDVVENTAMLAEVVVPVYPGQGLKVDVLTRGTDDISAVDFFRSTQVQSLFRLLKSRYDHILIDAPPLLQVAYATSVVSLADAVALVIPHEGRVQIHEELIDRLDLLGVETLGYIYNKAPRRPELYERRGSMLDPLGTGITNGG